MQFKKAKLEQKLTFEKKTEEKKQQDINAKLPKQVKEHTCWLAAVFGPICSGSWRNVYVLQITKFSYFKELLDPFCP